MPEGHTIHRQLMDQEPWLVGQELTVTSPNRRFSSGAALLDGRKLLRMEAYGKNLFYFFPGRRVLQIHLGMDGRFRRFRMAPKDLPPAGAGAWLRVSAPELTFDLTQPKVCRVIDEVHQRSMAERLGPDPLRPESDPSVGWQRLSRFEGPLGVALLDQSVVAGIGNVYRAEVLFERRLHPELPVSAVGPDEWAAIWETAGRQLRAGVDHRGDIVTVDPRDLSVRDGRETWVYGQRTCARCGSRIRRWDLAGRICYACETCQPPPARSGSTAVNGQSP